MLRGSLFAGAWGLTAFGAATGMLVVRTPPLSRPSWSAGQVFGSASGALASRPISGIGRDGDLKGPAKTAVPSPRCSWRVHRSASPHYVRQPRTSIQEAAMEAPKASAEEIVTRKERLMEAPEPLAILMVNILMLKVSTSRSWPAITPPMRATIETPKALGGEIATQEVSVFVGLLMFKVLFFAGFLVLKVSLFVSPSTRRHWPRRRLHQAPMRRPQLRRR